MGSSLPPAHVESFTFAFSSHAACALATLPKFAMTSELPLPQSGPITATEVSGFLRCAREYSETVVAYSNYLQVVADNPNTTPAMVEATRLEQSQLRRWWQYFHGNMGKVMLENVPRQLEEWYAKGGAPKPPPGPPPNWRANTAQGQPGPSPSQPPVTFHPRTDARVIKPPPAFAPSSFVSQFQPAPRLVSPLPGPPPPPPAAKVHQPPQLVGGGGGGVTLLPGKLSAAYKASPPMLPSTHPAWAGFKPPPPGAVPPSSCPGIPGPTLAKSQTVPVEHGRKAPPPEHMLLPMTWPDVPKVLRVPGCI